jgi:DNA invertase Pin-like site-specific DNA recombinase
MMTEVRKSRVEIVVVYKLDRLGRSLQHLAQLIEEFAAHGTALVSTSQGIDTSESNPAGKFTLHILAAVAEFERSNILERIKVGITAAKARGVTFGRPRSLDSHRDTVTELSRQGLSSRKIAAKLEIPPGSVFTILRQAKLAA